MTTIYPANPCANFNEWSQYIHRFNQSRYKVDLLKSRAHLGFLREQIIEEQADQFVKQIKHQILSK